MQLLPPPGPQRRRQLILLGALLLVLGIYFGRQYWPTAAAPAPTSKEGAANSVKGKDVVLPEAVNNEKLEPPPEASQTERNPFQFGQPPAPKLPPAPPPGPLTPVGPPPQPQPPPPPQVPLRCTGMTVVPSTKQRIALMFDPETNSSQWMLDGSIFDGRYKIVKVNADSVVVSFIDGTGQKTVFAER